MARRRDLRRFGPGPYVTALRRDEAAWGSGFPFDVPAVAAAGDLALDAPVTLLAGDNGTGKSTLIEAIAEAMGFAPEGGELTRLGELPAVPRPVLDGALAPVLTTTKPRNGYFLRAESFFNLATQVDELGVNGYGSKSLHAQSHGESFLALMMNRFRGDGLYILDEPEAALSPNRQLAMLARMHDLVRDASQFLIATHSPILMAYPDATILSCDGDRIHEVAYEETEHYIVTKDFLNHRERMLRELLG